MSKGKPRLLGIGALVTGVVVLAAAAIAIAGCGSGGGTSQSTSTSAALTGSTQSAISTGPSTGTSSSTQEANGLQIQDEVVGTGPATKAGDTVTVNYTGWLTSGKKFDASADHGQPFTFTLGQGQVITGWDQGVAGMKAGGKRKLTIPPELGYGAQGAGGVIPPNATLIFEVELVKIG